MGAENKRIWGGHAAHNGYAVLRLRLNAVRDPKLGGTEAIS